MPLMENWLPSLLSLTQIYVEGDISLHGEFSGSTGANPIEAASQM